VKRKRTPAPAPIKAVVAKAMVPKAAAPEIVVPEAILEAAKRAIEADRIRKPMACVVCGGECAPSSTETLCWVCRRLKLSAWRDSDSQMPAQE
jgi:hypothetical protein